MDTEKVDEAVIAEAVAWITRLHGSGRSAAEEAAFREWLQADDAHAQAFSRATDIWELIPGAARVICPSRPTQRQRHVFDFRWSLAGAAVAACAVLIAFFVLRNPTYATAIGQQQTLTLEDGSRLSLNTDTRVEVHYSPGERRIHLRRGEALFSVVADPLRPFIVEVGAERIRALGTKFVVRRGVGQVSVTLIEGSVAVARQATPQPQSAGSVLLKPGERLTIREAASATTRLDRPKPETVAAWRRGEVLFDDVSLQEAAMELGRYGGPRLVMEAPGIGHLRVSGVFSTSDPEEFAEAMAQMYRLRVTRDGAEITLSQ